MSMRDPSNTQARFLRGRLVIETGENAGMIFPLRETVISIGRGPENTIQVIDSHMSRNHSLLILNEGYWYARDLGSKNGTLVNDRPITGDKLLAHGDCLRIGDTLFTYEQEDHQLVRSGEITTGVRVLPDDGTLTPSFVLKLRQELGNENEISSTFVGPTQDATRLSMLYTVAEMTSLILDLDELLEKVMDLIQRFLKPDRAGILLYDEHYDILLPKVIRRPANSHEDIVISSTIINQTVSEQVAVLTGDASSDNRFRAAESIVVQRIQSAICAPLIHKHQVLGVLYLDRRLSSAAFVPNDLKVVVGIANQAALAIANARLHRRLLEQHGQERELEIARKIQENLLPRTMPVLAGFSLAGMSRAARMVGGDYFDVVPLPDGRVVLAIADVSGKGVPAAILIASLRAAVQVEVRDLGDEPLVDVMDRLNQMVCRDTAGNMFVTMVLGVLDPAAHSFTYCNAGHVHPILCHGDGHVDMLDVGGCFLGIMPGLTYEQATIELAPGSYLTFYSDGVTDMMNDRREMFGLQRILDFLVTAGGLPAESIMKRLEEAAWTFREGAEPFDDFTLMVLKAADE